MTTCTAASSTASGARSARALAAIVPAILACALLAPAVRAGAGAGAGITCVVNPGDPAASDVGPGTRAAPFRTAAAALASALARPGRGNRTVRLAPGIYPEQLAIDYHGAPGETLVIEGAPGAVLDGGRHLSDPGDWFPGPGDSWSVPWGGIRVLVDGHEIPRATAVLDSMPVPSWEPGPAGTYVNLGGENPGNHDVVLVGSLGYIAMTVSDAAHVLIQGLEIRYYYGKGVYMRGGHDNELRGNHVSYCGQYGIDLAGYSPTGSGDGHDITLDSNVVDHCGSNNINVEYVPGCVIQDNEAFGEPGTPGGVGIRLDYAPNAVVRRNRVHHNGDSGMELVTHSDHCVVTLNLSYQNGDHGYNQIYSSDNVFDSNVAWGNAHDGMSLEGGSTGCHVHNCIFADNGLSADHYDLFVADSSDRGLVSDDNIVWNHTADPPIKFLGAKYATVWAYAGATGQDSRSSTSDPRFVAPASGDFHLSAGSPAIDSGNSSEDDWPPLDLAGMARIDDPVAPNRGIGPITYADRGALEFQRQGPVEVETPPSLAGALSPPWPNPARATLWFTLELRAAAPVQWEIVDLQGRRVASHARALLPAGSTRLQWDLTDGAGRRVPPGLYLARVTLGERRFTRRCVVVR